MGNHALLPLWGRHTASALSVRILARHRAQDSSLFDEIYDVLARKVQLHIMAVMLVGRYEPGLPYF